MNLTSSIRKEKIHHGYHHWLTVQSCHRIACWYKRYDQTVARSKVNCDNQGKLQEGRKCCCRSNWIHKYHILEDQTECATEWTGFLFKLFRAVEAISHGKIALFTQLLEMFHMIMNLSFVFWFTMQNRHSWMPMTIGKVFILFWYNKRGFILESPESHFYW